MKLSEVQKIILIIELMFFALFGFYLYHYPLPSKLIQFFGEEGFYVKIAIYLTIFFYMMIPTISILFLLDGKSKQFSRLQKFGLFVGVLFVNSYLMSILRLIGGYFHALYRIYFPNMYSMYHFHPDLYTFPFYPLFKSILLIMITLFFTWLWIFMFKKRENNL